MRAGNIGPGFADSPTTRLRLRSLKLSIAADLSFDWSSRQFDCDGTVF